MQGIVKRTRIGVTVEWLQLNVTLLLSEVDCTSKWVIKLDQQRPIIVTESGDFFRDDKISG